MFCYGPEMADRIPKLHSALLTNPATHCSRPDPTDTYFTSVICFYQPCFFCPFLPLERHFSPESALFLPAFLIRPPVKYKMIALTVSVHTAVFREVFSCVFCTKIPSYTARRDEKYAAFWRGVNSNAIKLCYKNTD